MITKKIFFGIECEGKWNGLPTIFIPCSCMKTNLPEDMPLHLYIGAGCDLVKTQTQLDSAIELVEKNESKLVTIEIDITANIKIPTCLNSRRVRLLFNFNPKLKDLPNILTWTNSEVKIASKESLAVYSTPQFLEINYLDDYLHEV
tara:strand:+ start:140 stop:577 length:438 start_codon:yes stop_codon:yes gene_type:complete